MNSFSTWRFLDIVVSHNKHHETITKRSKSEYNVDNGVLRSKKKQKENNFTTLMQSFLQVTFLNEKL